MGTLLILHLNKGQQQKIQDPQSKSIFQISFDKKCLLGRSTAHLVALLSTKCQKKQVFVEMYFVLSSFCTLHHQNIEQKRKLYWDNLLNVSKTSQTLQWSDFHFVSAIIHTKNPFSSELSGNLVLAKFSTGPCAYLQIITAKEEQRSNLDTLTCGHVLRF